MCHGGVRGRGGCVGQVSRFGQIPVCGGGGGVEGDKGGI